jgi:hypothetical protein
MPAGVTIDVADDDVRPRASGSGTITNDAGFTDLKEQLEQANKDKEAERKRANDADATARREREAADRARSDAQAARAEGLQGNKDAIATAIAASKNVMDDLEARYSAAFDAGDSKTVAAIQRRMAETAADLKTLETGAAQLEREPAPAKRTAATTEGAVTRQDETLSEFEKYVRQFTPSTQDWLRRHPECVTNRTKNSQIIAAHNEAVDAGHSPESDDYFDFIEQKMGYRGDRARRAVAADNPLDDDPPARRGEPVRTSAAVSRGSASGGGSSKISLSANEVEHATDGTIVWNLGQTDGRGVVITDKDPRFGQPIGEYEMARRKKLLQQEGRYVIPSLQD